MTVLTLEQQEPDHVDVDLDQETIPSLAYPMPSWVPELRSDWGEAVVVDEWQQDDGTYRAKHGWQGRDLVHDKEAPVRILDYYANYGPGIASFFRGGVGTTLTGVCHFTKRAESHAGYCHGGSMCSLLDDVVGWAAFLVTGKCCPWTGFTVQINSSLQRPIPVDSILLVQATITKVDRRKVSVRATIVDPSEENAIHATGEGLVILNRGVLPEPDEKEIPK